MQLAELFSRIPSAGVADHLTPREKLKIFQVPEFTKYRYL